MLGAQTSVIDSYLGWWRDAGFVDAVGDAPHDWFAKPVAQRPAEPAKMERSVTPPSAAPKAPAAAAPKSLTLPDSVVAFDQWLATAADVPGADWSARCLPTGPADAPLMILADVPDAEDVTAGTLFSGAAGRLLDAMLRAIGRSRGDVRIASIALTRPVAGRIDGAEAAALTAIARHHIALVRPRHLLLLGQQTSQLFTVENQPDVNQDGTTMVTLALHHPRLLLERPMLKRQAWDVLKTLKELG
jgi:uracil-DNA glycosylase